MSYDRFTPHSVFTGRRLEHILHDRFVYEERAEIKRWYENRKSRIEEILKDDSYEYRGQLVVTRPRKKDQQQEKELEGWYHRVENGKLVRYKVDTNGDLENGENVYSRCSEGNDAIKEMVHRLEDKNVVVEESIEDQKRRERKRKRAEQKWKKMVHKTREQLKEQYRRAHNGLEPAEADIVVDEMQEEQDLSKVVIVFKGLRTGLRYTHKGDFHSTSRYPKRTPSYGLFEEPYGDINTTERFEIAHEIQDDHERGLVEFETKIRSVHTAKDNMMLIDPIHKNMKVDTGSLLPVYTKKFNVEMSGLEPYSRQFEVATILRDTQENLDLIAKLSPQTQKFLDHSGSSQNDKSVLIKFPPPTNLKSYCRSYIPLRSGFSERIIDTMNVITRKAMIAHDFELLEKLLTMFLRLPHTILRPLYVPIIELLLWRYEKSGDPQAVTKFIDWMVITYPDNRTSLDSNTYRRNVHASSLIPVAIVIKLRTGQTKAAIEQLEELTLDIQGLDPVFHYYLCLGYMRMARDALEAGGVVNEQMRFMYLTKARGALELVEKNGGTYPKNIIEFELNALEEGYVNGHFSEE